MHSPEKFPHWVLFRALLVFSCTQEQVLPCSCIFVLYVFFPAAPGLDRQDRPYGKETCNMAARFLIAHGIGKIRTLVTTLWGLSGEAVYGSVFDQLVGAVVEFVNLNPELRTMPTVDMFDYFDEEVDVDDE